MQYITTPSSQEEAIADKISKKFWQNEIWDYSTIMPERAAIQTVYISKLFIPLLNKNMTVGELACSNGFYTRQVAPYVKHIDAFELSHSMIDIAKKETEKEGITNISYFQADATEIIFTKEYDAFMCLGLFTCIINTLHVKEIIYKISNTLKKGAFLILKDTLHLSDAEDKVLNKTDYAAIYRNKEKYCSIFLENGFKVITTTIISQPDEIEQIGSFFLLFQKQ